MPWTPRVVVSGGIYHVFARGNNAQKIFFDNIDRYHYLRLLGAVSKRLEIAVLAFALMSNHVHLVLRVSSRNLDAGIHLIHRPYAFRFNRRHGRIGHMFNNRYQSLPVVDDAYLLQSTSYIHLNPVVIGLVKHPRDYIWSSYRQYATPRSGQLVDPNRVFSILEDDQERCRVAYEDFVAADLIRRKQSMLGRGA